MMGKDILNLRHLVLSLLMAAALNVCAVPAKPGLWRTLHLTNGKEVRAQLRGDEWFHFYVDVDGNTYIEKKPNRYKKVSQKKLEKMRKRRLKRRGR